MSGLRGNEWSHDNVMLERPTLCEAVDGRVNDVDAAFVRF